MAADPDFTEDLLWKNLSPEVKAQIMEAGVQEITWGVTKYPISRSLIEDGRNNFVLRNPRCVALPLGWHGMAWHAVEGWIVRSGQGQEPRE